jgi:hypothetical protein
MHCVLEGLREAGVEGPAIVHDTVSGGVVSSFGNGRRDLRCQRCMLYAVGAAFSAVAP